MMAANIRSRLASALRARMAWASSRTFFAKSSGCLFSSTALRADLAKAAVASATASAGARLKRSCRPNGYFRPVIESLCNRLWQTRVIAGKHGTNAFHRDIFRAGARSPKVLIKAMMKGIVMQKRPLFFPAIFFFETTVKDTSVPTPQYYFWTEVHSVIAPSSNESNYSPIPAFLD